MKELISKRTEFGKSYDIGDGKERINVFLNPQHYNNNGKWDDVGLSLNLLLSSKDYSSHYLADKNKWSYGFRNDKRLEKFYGIRRGASNQLEGTLKRVELDGNVVSLPNKFDKINKVSPTEIEHTIGEDLSSYTKINVNGFKNALKTNQWLQTFDIEERLDIKGFTITNDFVIDATGKKEYIVDEYGAFNFRADTGDILPIQPASMWNLTNTCNNGITHRLIEDKGELVYSKTTNKVGEEWLLLNKPPYYIDITVYYTLSVTLSCGSTAWSTARTGGASISRSTGSHIAGTQYYNDGKGTLTYYVYHGFFTFNLSSYTGTLSSATLYVYGSIASSPHNMFVYKYGDTSTWDTTTNNYTSSMYMNQTTATWFSAAMNLNQVTLGTTNNYRFREYEHDVLNSAPGDGVAYYSTYTNAYISFVVSAGNAIFFGFNF